MGSKNIRCCSSEQVLYDDGSSYKLGDHIVRQNVQSDVAKSRLVLGFEVGLSNSPELVQQSRLVELAMEVNNNQCRWHSLEQSRLSFVHARSRQDFLA